MKITQIEKEILKTMPEFIKAMNMVETHGADLVLTTIFSFDNPEILYEALRLRAARGIVVQFVPTDNHPLLSNLRKVN